jgi:glucose-6-phosphate 1-epimerase
VTNLEDIDDLNRRFGVAGVAQVVAGNGGLGKVRIETAAASAEIHLHGAQVTSWHPAGFAEVIFLSERSRWEDGRAIRGGIPICFPWFRGKADNPKAPAHGVVRTKEWRIDSLASKENGDVVATFSTESDDASRAWWPYEFRLVHRVTVGRSLRLELIAANTGTVPFQFEEALHTYFRVGKSENVRVTGLDGTRYLDNTDGNREKTQSGDVTFSAQTDNAYLDTRSALELLDLSLHRVLRTDKENSNTTVVWNPWEQGAAGLPDLGKSEWERFACVEASNILRSAIELAPGQEHTLRAILSVQAG